MSTQGSTAEGRRWLRRRGRLLIAGIVAAFAVAAVPVAWSAFNDVPPGHPFKPDIDAIQTAGITTGCGGGNFCPEDNITRQAEAAFVHRAAGRVAMVNLPFADTPTVVNTEPAGWNTTITAGAIGAGHGFIKVDGMLEFFGETGCPCQVDFKVWVDGVAADTWFTEAVVGDAPDVIMIPITAVVPVAIGSHTISIRGHRSSGTGTPTALGTITAIYAPFGSTGQGTLGATGAAGSKGTSNR